MIPQPDLRAISQTWYGRVTYRLENHYLAQWTGANGRRYRATIPAGFRCDLSSEWLLLILAALVPLTLSALDVAHAGAISSAVFLALIVLGVAADGLQRAGALVHDFAFRHRGKMSFERQTRDEWSGELVWESLDCMTLAEADHAFLALSRAGGMSRPRVIFRSAIRLVSWAVWRRR